MRPVPSLPRRIAGIPVPQDDVSADTWRWAHRSLPGYLLKHSVRVYCWCAAIAAAEDWRFDRRIVWTASLLHDLGLARISTNTMCFEVEGAEFARRFLQRMGMAAGESDRVAIAIVLHMRPNVTLGDGVEAVLLDRATGLDVRGTGYEVVDAERAAVVRAFPRGAFDRLFVAAIRREVAIRPSCQSARLLNRTRLVESMAKSPWATREIGG